MNTRAPTQTKAKQSFTPFSGGLLQRKCTSYNQHTLGGSERTECQKNKSLLQRRATGQAETLEVPPPIVYEVLNSPGQPLDANTRTFMESRFGHDFSSVRVHVDAKAAESAQVVNALAYTVGQNIVFGAGQYSPTINEGKQLLAHELTHVIQQGDRSFNTSASLQFDHPTSISEQEASASADRVMQQSQVTSISKNVAVVDSPQIQRQTNLATDERKPTGLPYIDSIFALLTLDAFTSDSAELTEAHSSKIAAYKKRVAQLMKLYPDSYITIVGHTDATDTEQHNQMLGQQRAETVMKALGEGDLAIPQSIMRAYSLGKTSLKVQTKNRESRNRRVEVSFTARRYSYRDLPTLSPSQPPIGTGPKIEIPSPIPPGPFGAPKLPSIPPYKPPTYRHEIEQLLEGDPILRQLRGLSKPAFDAVVDGAMRVDEIAVDKALDFLPVDGETKKALKAAAKALLRTLKGEKFQVPIPPSREQPPSNIPQPPRAPREFLLPLPPIKF
ncbi:eCIS core domain-containing protein [Iningainema tapete]|uniref:DUF4157 domain-containing protein n=1 Tax=Iningainema tapete BLCC-T55 TaxID=2748662 RepID=A0A8J6XCU1_9CYAN|nr:DUF4157 domain-containing protein [Iningainema tapete]MBD2773375.1 DUF4157 domain-containing protein [Iningainema tapete BLCC-T55]